MKKIIYTTMFWIVSSVTKFSLQVKLQIQNLQSRSQFFYWYLNSKTDTVPKRSGLNTTPE